MPLQALVAQKKDNSGVKKPVLTNKYRLKKRAQPSEGVQSKGSVKIPEQRTVVSGYKAGEKRYTQAPQVMGQSQFRGTDPIFPREKQTGFATFKSNYKFKPHEHKKGFARFLSNTKYKPHQFRRGYDKFIASEAYMPYQKRTGYDKFVSKYRFKPHEFRRGYDEFTGKSIKYGFLEKRRKAIRYNTRKQQSYAGNIKYINWKQIRQKRSHRMATSLGALKIKYYPRKSKLSNRQLHSYKANPYNARKLRPGKFMWKKDLPRFQKYKAKKPKYHSSEKQGTMIGTSRKGEILYPYRGTVYVDDVDSKGNRIKRRVKVIISDPAPPSGLPLNAPSRISSKEVKQKQKEQKLNKNIEQEPKQD
ncbi:MAG: hypothetical protein OHK0045_19810 [Raineya sp.]